MSPPPGVAHDVLFGSVQGERARVTVCVSLFDYARYIGEALESVRAQDFEAFDLVVVDDGSTDGGERLVAEWMARAADRFGRCSLVRHARNEGLAAARNTGFARAETELVFVLDSDNQLFPRALGRLVEAIDTAGADFAFPIMERFGEEIGLMNLEPWDPRRLQQGNSFDAMALLRRSAWEAVGGYTRMAVPGWEDYDLWCKLAELGMRGVQVPEILARYRVHSRSMLRTVTNPLPNIRTVAGEMQRRHPWLALKIP